MKNRIIKDLVGDIVEITWRDSNRYDNQEGRDYSFEVSIIKSIGELIYKDEDKVVIARDIIGDDVRGTIVIPTENIIED